MARIHTRTALINGKMLYYTYQRSLPPTRARSRVRGSPVCTRVFLFRTGAHYCINYTLTCCIVLSCVLYIHWFEYILVGCFELFFFVPTEETGVVGHLEQAVISLVVGW